MTGFQDPATIAAGMTGAAVAGPVDPQTSRVPDRDTDGFTSTVLTTKLSDIEPEEVSWLWHGRIPFGKLTLFAGDPGLGKSFVTMDITARYSSGTSWPDRRSESVESGTVVILSAEDDPADTIRPRLDAADADVSRVHVVNGVKRSPKTEAAFFCLDGDLQALGRLIETLDARLVVVDPITAYLGDQDGHSNARVRGVLGPLAELAARHGCAVIAVSHLNKAAGGQAIYRTMGSLAFTAAARIAWLFAEHPDDETQRVMLPIKSNLVERPPGIGFRIEDGRVNWSSEQVELDADAVLASAGSDRVERNAAADWLMGMLARGPLPVTELKKAAESDCFSWRTIERAKKSLGVRSQREGFGSSGRFVWLLSDAAEDEAA